MTKPLPPEKRKRRFRVVDWTEARIELLRTMFADRRSAREIAYAVQGGATRNAVLGKLHRLGLVRRSAMEITRLSTAKNEIAAFERKRTRAERQRAMIEPREAAKTPQGLAEAREKRAAGGRAFIAKVELTLIDNPAFVVAKVEKPPDLYAHLRTERGYHDAIAALSR